MGRRRESKNSKCKKKLWKIAIYIRLSREDGMEESRSVTEQRKMLEEYIDDYFTEENIVVDFYVDDGLTGTDDTRDNFQRMIDDMYSGKINCILCKTLSRAFRNYADQGRYLEEVFPKNNIRFISMSNPHVDSYTDLDAIQNGMEIPINGLMNDRYAAKTSADIRKTFDAKRRRGEFIGAFAPYGYEKDPIDKNRLMIDEEAAHVVKDIFLWFVNKSMSKNGIALKLNQLGIPNPTAYKVKIKKLSYKNSNGNPNDGKWAGPIISRILRNEVYIGNMVQGRQRVISYKVHNTISVPEEDWYVVPNTHEAIIDKELFKKAQALHSKDTRVAPGKRNLYLFSGFITCYDCNKAMRRKTAKNLVYYYCRTKTDKGSCTKHGIREDKLTQAVLDAIRLQIKTLNSLNEVLDSMNSSPRTKKQSLRLNNMLKLKNMELQNLLKASDSLYLDWKSNAITQDDYMRMKANFDEQVQNLKESIEAIQDESKIMENGINSDDPYLTAFQKHENINTLERGILVELVDKIYVHEDSSLTIDFKFADEMKRVVNYIENNNCGLTVVTNEAI